MASIIQLRGGTASAWTSTNPTLAQNEFGVETDTNRMKRGDGATAWTSLAYFETGEVTLSGAQTFVNKVITYADNTLTGVLPTSAIGSTVQAYDATLLNDADIGSTVQAYDATILVDADIGTTVQAFDADIAKLDVAQTFTAAQTMTALKETKVAMGAHNIDLSAGNYFTYTLSGAQTLTISNVASSGSVSAFVLEVTNGGSAALTFFSGVTWAAATPPTLTAAGVDTLAFFTTDGGTTWRGFVLGLGMA